MNWVDFSVEILLIMNEPRYFQQSLQMDNFFIYALLKDIVSGLSFIQTSFLQFHGHLTSEFCLIDDRWQIKVAYHGPKSLRNNDKYVVKGRRIVRKEIQKFPFRNALDSTRASSNEQQYW